MKISVALLTIIQVVAGVRLSNRTNTPEGCKRLATDSEWPEPAEWIAAMPDVEPYKQIPGFKHTDYILRAESYKDVQKAVQFCSKHNIRLVIITSGHDFLGRNDAPSGLTLDVSLLKGIQVLESFEPTDQGAVKPPRLLNTIVPVPGKQAAVTFGAGVSTQQLHNAVYPSKLFTVGAAHGSVSVAGGWGLAGGHGPLTHKYGLGADQVLEYKVVTADGQLKVANAVSHPDLFWALRGGGGSTFGVVVEATVKAYPNEHITAVDFVVENGAGIFNNNGLWDAYVYFASQMPDIVKRGVSGYFYFQPMSIRTLMIHPGNISGTANVQSFWKPYLDKMSSFPGMKPANVSIFNYGNYKHYFDAHFGETEGEKVADEDCEPGMRKRHGPGMDMAAPVPQGGPMPIDSRLLGRAHLTSPNLKAALQAAAPGLQGHLVANPDLKYENTSVLPAWRKAYVHMIGTKMGNFVSLDSLRKLAPDMGAYSNEAFYGEENWKTTFWGSNYPMLSQVKSRYDPDMVFWASPAINADFMEVRDDGRLCKVATPANSIIAPMVDNKNGRRRMAAGESINGMAGGFGVAPKGPSGCSKRKRSSVARPWVDIRETF